MVTTGAVGTTTTGTRAAVASRSVVPGARSADRARPSSQTVLTLLLLFLLPVSFLPATRGFFFRLYPLPPAWWTDNLIVGLAFAVCVFRLLGGYSRPVGRSTRRAILQPVLVLAAWQTLSLIWNGRDGLMRSYSFLQSLCMGSAVLAAVCLTSGLADPARHRVGRGITVTIALITSVYAGLSFVFPSWRPSSSWMDRTAATLGFIRVFGPLGTATTLNFALVPALGFSVGMLRRPGSVRLFWAGLALFFVTAILLTGSRGGLLSLAAFTAILMIALRLRSLVFLVPTGLILLIVLIFVGVPERLRNIEDNARTATYATAFRALASRPQNVVLGVGHGGLYSKLHDDAIRSMYGEDRWYLLEGSSPYGYTLRNSHSTFLRSLAETGPLGLVLTLIPLLAVLSRLLRPRYLWMRDPSAVHAKSILAGCAALIPYMAFEEFFISAFWIVLLWTIYAVIGAETIDDALPTSTPAVQSDDAIAGNARRNVAR